MFCPTNNRTFLLLTDKYLFPVRLISQFMNRKKIIKNGYLPNIFIIVPGVMIKFTDFIYITECPQVAARWRELSGYDRGWRVSRMSLSWHAWWMLLYIFRKRVCKMPRSLCQGKVYSKKFVTGLQSVDGGFSMYSGLLNQES